MPGFPLARGSAWAGGRDHTPSRVPQRWGTTSCREAAPLTHYSPMLLQVDAHRPGGFRVLVAYSTFFVTPAHRQVRDHMCYKR